MNKFERATERFAEGSIAYQKKVLLRIVLQELQTENIGEPFRYEKIRSYLDGVSLIAKINEIDLSRWLKLVPEKNKDLRIFFEHLQTLNSGIKHITDMRPMSVDSTPYFLEELLTKTLAMRKFQLYRQAMLTKPLAMGSFQLHRKSPLLSETPKLGFRFDEDVDSVVTTQISLFSSFGSKKDYWETTVFSGLSYDSPEMESSVSRLQKAISELRSLYKAYKTANHRGKFPTNNNDEEYIPTPDVAFAAQSYYDYMDYVDDKITKMMRRLYS